MKQKITLKDSEIRFHISPFFKLCFVLNTQEIYNEINYLTENQKPDNRQPILKLCNNNNNVVLAYKSQTFCFFISERSSKSMKSLIA